MTNTQPQAAQVLTRQLSEGPAVTVTKSCSSCKHERSESYKVQSDSGQDVRCLHPDAPEKNYIGDTCWKTPDWCPVVAKLQAATPAESAQPAEGGEVAGAIRKARKLAEGTDLAAYREALADIGRVMLAPPASQPQATPAEPAQDGTR